MKKLDKKLKLKKIENKQKWLKFECPKQLPLNINDDENAELKQYINNVN